MAELAAQPEMQVIQTIGACMGERIPRPSMTALFSGSGVPLAGKGLQVPRDVPLDGRPHSIDITLNDTSSGRLVSSEIPMRAVAERLPNGDILVVGRSLEDLVQLREALASALTVGLIPTVLLTLLLSAIVSWRMLRRVQNIDTALGRIISGELSERLPTRGTNDSLDRLVTSVNATLDKISILLNELRDTGNNIAHDLRTPLARVRGRLERSLAHADSDSEITRTIEGAISELDHAAAMIAALLRIGEIEDRQRRSAFSSINVAALVYELYDDYQPVAEHQGIEFTTQVDPVMHIVGDWHLMTEALSNLVENALKFTPAGGTVRLQAYHGGQGGIIRIADTGPGIPKEDQGAVFARFYRSQQSRHVSGSGLGLSLVHAICRLHGYTIAVVGGPPGCTIDINCGEFHRDLHGLSVATSARGGAAQR